MILEILCRVFEYLDYIIHNPAIFMILCIIFFLLGMFVIKGISVYANESSGIHYVDYVREPLPMASFYHPFSFEVDYGTASYSGIKCILKTDHACIVQAFWGVPISTVFRSFAEKDWEALKQAVTSNVTAELFGRKCVASGERFFLFAGEEKTTLLKPPVDSVETLIEALGSNSNHHPLGSLPQRTTFPLVVLMVLDERSDGMQEPFVVAMANAVHLPDRHLKLSTHLIGQYIKLSSGQTGQIKKIFVSSVDSNDEDGGSTYDLCCICYSRPVTVVILPCRHACLCPGCFDSCTRCPVCRSAIINYFTLPDI